jgi:hypothetical protein
MTELTVPPYLGYIPSMTLPILGRVNQHLGSIRTDGNLGDIDE